MTTGLSDPDNFDRDDAEWFGENDPKQPRPLLYDDPASVERLVGLLIRETLDEFLPFIEADFAPGKQERIDERMGKARVLDYRFRAIIAALSAGSAEPDEPEAG